MCSTEESCDYQPGKTSTQNKSDRRSKCVRCGGARGQPALVIRSDDPALCRKCFLDGCLHKFKSAFGKSQVVPCGARVAVAFSGGLGSCVMLDLLQRNNNIRFTPVIFHLIEHGRNSEYLNEIKSNGLEVQLLDPLQNRLLTDFYNQLRLYSTKSNLSEYGELATFLRNMVLTRCACQLGCDFILLGTSGTRHAMNFLNGVVGGRGSFTSSDTMFVDRRHKNVTILRPMFEFMSKELVFYAQFRGLRWLAPNDPVTEMVLQRPGLTTIPRLCEDFLIGLQTDGFPSTTQTILSTASKLVPMSNASSPETVETCRLCLAPILQTVGTTNPHTLALASLAHSQSLSRMTSPNQSEVAGDSDIRLCSACHSLYSTMTTELKSTFVRLLCGLEEDSN